MEKTFTFVNFYMDANSHYLGGEGFGEFNDFCDQTGSEKDS
jgi:hypothetical protein